MSEHPTREQLVAQAAEAVYEASRPPFEPTGPDWADLPDQWRWLDLVGPALPVIAKAITDRIRTGHTQTLRCIRLPPRGQVACPCLPLCAGCDFHVPCPTVRLANEIDTEMGVQR